MATAIPLDADAIGAACAQYGVKRLRVFGSVLTESFDPRRSDVDFVVEFEADRENVFHDYFDLQSALEQIVGRDVDLVMANAVKNPYIAKSIFDSAEDVYAA
ncbi:MAG: toxin-antitoxin system toxin subunit [Gordonia sp.]|uniref:nucleotidyltransferase family protein n=1 Tax=Williamsia sp. 1138 TaxID=1903117 RepID=UPI000A0F7F96|nr:nucleotidyltransferase domain-containing protein [Williamsia sp. 1138]MBA4022883.1 toxin-antitoxin system toxin subunit [Gordonia sp. (in: high G+C Gram-positive bacteria)]OZG29913.1 toxin-antitoxin system toxin subunit [Williamsia sp. 1138]